jgi:broad specificity phosphatase PhoE
VTDREKMLPRIHLIRHGETEWTLSGKYTGRTDIPLTAHGENMARELGLRLRGIPFAHVLTSPLRRARQTCALAGLTPAPVVDPDLAEWDYGDYEGRTPLEIRASRPSWNQFRDGSPNGETPGQISDRVDGFIARLCELHGNIALFSHGHFGRILGARWIGLSVSQAQRLLLGTTSLSVLCYEHERRDQPAIESWNVASPEASFAPSAMA